MTRVKTFTKRKLIEELSRKTVLPKSEIERFLLLFISLITETLKERGKVQLIHFGTFSVSERKGRTTRNPKTGAVTTTPSRRVPVFKPGKLLKSALTRP